MQTLESLVPLYESYLHGESRRPRGADRYLWGMRRMITWLEAELGRPAVMTDLTAHAVRRYKMALGERGLRPSTMINALANIRDFSIFAIGEGLRMDDPTAGIKRPKKQRPNPKPLYPEDILVLLQALEMPADLSVKRQWVWQRNRRAVLVFLYSGARLSEGAALRWGAVKLESGIIEIRDGKGGKDRNVPVHAVLDEVLRAVPLDERRPTMPVIGKRAGDVVVAMTDKGVERIFSRWLIKRLDAIDAEQHVHAHRLRHTFASLLVWNDQSIKTIQELLGHAHLGTTEWYLLVRDVDKRSAIDALPTFR